MSELERLVSQLTGGDDESAESAALALARMGVAALPSLRELVQSQEIDRRWWAVRAMAGMEQPPVELIAARLSDAAAEVRAAAALALAAHPAESAVPALVEALNDEDDLVSTLCVNALVGLGPACVPALLEAFAAQSGRGRIQVMRTLAAIKDPRAIAVMLKATEAESAVLAYWAGEGLDALGLNMVYLIPD